MRHSSFTSENQGQPVSNHKLYVHTQCGQTVYDFMFEVLRTRDSTKVKPAVNYRITVQDGRKITQNVLGEYKVITTEQQFLAVILGFLMHLRWPWLSRFFA